MARPGQQPRRAIIVSPHMTRNDFQGSYYLRIVGGAYCALALVNTYIRPNLNWAAIDCITAGLAFGLWLVRHDRMNKPPRHRHRP